jgi:hypothetical protein
MAMSLDRLNRRFRTLARARGHCPIHGCRLWCVCSIVWEGTADEWREFITLAAPLYPFVDRLPLSVQRCPNGEPLFCDECYLSQMAALDMPDDDDFMTEAARDRYAELAQRFTSRPWDHTRPPPPLPEWLTFDS